MKRYKTVDEYILNAINGRDVLMILRALLNSTELVETVKWGAPCYTINEKNVIGLGSFKSYAGLWFFQGALLNDDERVLTNAQDKTKSVRQWHFQSVDDIKDKLILKYVNEAIENQKQNKHIKPDHNRPVIIPEELKELLRSVPELDANFKTFTKGKQREFAEYISEAKQVKTKQTRLQKIIPLIQQNVGLNDKYRK